MGLGSFVDVFDRQSLKYVGKDDYVWEVNLQNGKLTRKSHLNGLQKFRGETIWYRGNHVLFVKWIDFKGSMFRLYDLESGKLLYSNDVPSAHSYGADSFSPNAKFAIRRGS